MATGVRGQVKSRHENDLAFPVDGQIIDCGVDAARRRESAG
jgi:hypothetical protein